MSNLFYVYEHWRPDTGACFYVGKGKRQRAWIMRGRNRHHRAIQSKLTSLGMSVDIRIIVDGLSEETAFAVERDRIAMHGRAALVNWTDGGDGVSNPTAEARAKIAAALKGNKHSKGRVYTAAQRAVISARMRGNKNFGDVVAQNQSEEHRAKVAAALRGRPGRKKSAAEKERIGAASRGKKRPAEVVERMRIGIRAAWARKPNVPSKPIICLDSGIIFESAKAAAAHYEIDRSSIQGVCKYPEKRKTAAGYRFAYLNKEAA